MANAEKEIAKLKKNIIHLEDEVEILRGNPPPKRLADGSIDTSEPAEGTLSGVEALRFQETIGELEDKLRKLEEEKQMMTEMHESVSDELKEKEQELELLDMLKEEVGALRSNEQTLSKVTFFCLSN